MARMWQGADESWREGTREVLAVWITELLSLHAQLDYMWPHDRWLDGISIERFVVSDEENMICAEGVLWWGLRSDAGGKQTDEPFTGTIRVVESKRRPLSYDLSFGRGAQTWSFVRRSARSSNSL